MSYETPPSNELARWMRDVLRLHASARRSATEEVVHDLRVALRRCRSAARCAEEIDADPAWKELRDRSKRLFQNLGDLRDAQVQILLVDSWDLPSDPALRAVRADLRQQEKKAKARARRALEKFDRAQWRGLAALLPGRLEHIREDRASLVSMILARWKEARALHRVAARDDAPQALHAARIGTKKLRYALEFLAPEIYQEWKPALRRAQDLLGEVHDCDVFQAMLERVEALVPSERSRWHERIASRRDPLVEEYRASFCGRRAPWTRLRADIERHPCAAPLAMPDAAPARESSR